MSECPDKALKLWKSLRISHVVITLLSAVMMFENISRRVGSKWDDDSLPMILMPLLIHGTIGFVFLWTVRWSEPRKLSGALIINVAYCMLACLGLAIGAVIVFSGGGGLGEHGAWYALIAHFLQLLLCAANVVYIQQIQSSIGTQK